MTVKELIEELKECNSAAIVVRSIYDRPSDKWEDCEIDDIYEMIGSKIVTDGTGLKVKLF